MQAHGGLPLEQFVERHVEGIGEPGVQVGGDACVAGYACTNVAASATRDVFYGYDSISRLSTLTDDFAGTAGDVTTTFGYNPASQITLRGRTNDVYVYGADGVLQRTYTVNGLNQYLSAGSASFTYDANGNLTSDGSVTLTYDAENRLVTASGGTAGWIVYDPLGRLYETSGAGGAGVTRFLYDGIGVYRRCRRNCRHIWPRVLQM